jgi:serine/threonine-protein kinase HipA
MRKAEVFVHGILAGILEEIQLRSSYRFTYDLNYSGPPASLTMPVEKRVYDFDRFPPFFEGLLPEGYNLDALLRTCKIDRDDLFSQLLAGGADTVGAITVREIK